LIQVGGGFSLRINRQNTCGALAPEAKSGAFIVNLQTKVALILLSAVATIALAQSPTDDPSDPQARGYWTDPSTGLIWTAKDNGKDLRWKKAMKYCRDLRLSGHSDWRLPSIAELQAIYDKTANSPGLVGDEAEPMMWHVKGNLYLTADEWSSTERMDDRGKPSGYVYYFDFNEGRSNNDPTGWPYSFDNMRALCVRGSAK
jgi:hypothetical protein